MAESTENGQPEKLDASTPSEQIAETVFEQDAAEEPKRKRRKVVNGTITSIPAKDFGPPKDFAKVNVTRDRSGTAVLQSLGADLDTKQIWHISAPAGISMSSIKNYHV